MGKEQLTEKNYVRCEGVLVGVDFHTPRERPNSLLDGQVHTPWSCTVATIAYTLELHCCDYYIHMGRSINSRALPQSHMF